MAEGQKRAFAARLVQRYTPKFAPPVQKEGGDSDDSDDAFEDDEPVKKDAAPQSNPTKPGKAVDSKLASSSVQEAASSSAQTKPAPFSSAFLDSKSSSTQASKANGTLSHPASTASSSSHTAVSFAPSTPSSTGSGSSSDLKPAHADNHRNSAIQTPSAASSKIDKLLAEQDALQRQVSDLQRSVDSLVRSSAESRERLNSLAAAGPTSLDPVRTVAASMDALPKRLEELLLRTNEKQTHLIENLSKLNEAQQAALSDLQTRLDLSVRDLRNEIKAQSAHHTDLEHELLKREQSSFASVNRMIVGQAILWLFVLVVFLERWFQTPRYG